jgi:hypothetical protein
MCERIAIHVRECTARGRCNEWNNAMCEEVRCVKMKDDAMWEEVVHVSFTNIGLRNTVTFSKGRNKLD